MAKEKQEYDYEGDMAMSQLKSVIANAQRIHDMLERDTNIPEWVQSKITLAEDYITTAANYMQGEMSEETVHSVHVKTYDSQGQKQMNSPEFKKHVSAHGGELDYPSDKGAAFKFKSASHAAAFHRGVQSKFKELDSEHDMHEAVDMTNKNQAKAKKAGAKLPLDSDTGTPDHFTAAMRRKKGLPEDVAMGTGPVNVAANVADPKNKKLFTKPIKRFKNFKAE
jgi:phage pi2 protein 07